jgi:purine-binding chemotaxis protein CheW
VTAADELNGLTAPTRPWCLFRSTGGVGAFAVGLEAVAEVVEVERLVWMPHSPPRVLGLCTLRREVVPVIGLEPADCSGAAAGPGQAPRGKLLALILRTSQGPWAIRIAPEGTMVVEEPLEAPGHAPQTGPVPTPAFPVPALLGTVRRGETEHEVIDPERTWRNVRAGVESWYTDHWSRSAPSRDEPGGGGGGRPSETNPS